MFQGHKSCGSCKEGIKGIYYLKIVSEYDQQIPQSQTADKPMALRGRATQPVKKQQEDKQIKATSFLFPIKMIAKLEWT